MSLISVYVTKKLYPSMDLCSSFLQRFVTVLVNYYDMDVELSWKIVSFVLSLFLAVPVNVLLHSNWPLPIYFSFTYLIRKTF